MSQLSVGWEGLSEIGREFLFLPELGGRGGGAFPSPKYLQRYSIIMNLASWVRPSKTVFSVLAIYLIFVREHDKFCDFLPSPS